MTENVPETRHPGEDHRFEEQWFPFDKKHVWRQCVLPACHFSEKKDVSKA